MRQWAKTSIGMGCVLAILAVLLMAGAQEAAASTNVLLMPDRDAFKGQTIVVWGNTKMANGTAFTLDFGDLTAPVVGNVADQSYIAVTHVYNTANTSPGFTVTLTVGGEAETALVRVWDQAALSAFDERGLRVNMAIEDGLRFLYFNQFDRAARFNTNMTSWRSTSTGDNHTNAFSALVILSMQNQGHHITNNPLKDIFQPVVQRGLNWLFDTLTQRDLTPCAEVGGNPCVGVPAPVNIGLSANPGDGLDGYATPIYTSAIAAASGFAPGRLVDAGLGASNGNFVAGKTYAEVLQRTVNAVVWGQSDSAPGEGGWFYNLQAGSSSDGSTMGWGLLGLIDGGAAGATVPAFAKTEFAKVLPLQSRADGSLDYQVQGCCGGGGPQRTGIRIQGLAFLGVPAGDARVTDSLAHLVRNWSAVVDTIDFFCSGGSPTNWNKGCGYSMFNVFKGLKFYGISTLPGIGRPAGPGPIPADDWYADYVDNLLTNQHSPSDSTRGEWGVNDNPQMGWSCCESDTNGITALAELILSPVAFVTPSNLTLAPLSATNKPGTSHTVTATATTSGGAPVPGATVTFTVLSGPNIGVNGSSGTDAAGHASFTYADPAGVTGTDTIRANIGALLSNVVSKTWSSGPPNLSVGATRNNTRNGNTFNVEIRLRNSGGSQADNVTITSVKPKAPTTYIGPALPKNEGSLAAGASVLETLQFNVTGVATGAKVGFTVKGTYRNSSNKLLSFSAILSVTLIAP